MSTSIVKSFVLFVNCDEGLEDNSIRTWLSEALCTVAETFDLMARRVENDYHPLINNYAITLTIASENGVTVKQIEEVIRSVTNNPIRLIEINELEY